MGYFDDIYLSQGDDAYRFTQDDIDGFIEDAQFVRETALFTDTRTIARVQELREIWQPGSFFWGLWAMSMF